MMAVAAAVHAGPEARSPAASGASASGNLWWGWRVDFEDHMPCRSRQPRGYPRRRGAGGIRTRGLRLMRPARTTELPPVWYRRAASFPYDVTWQLGHLGNEAGPWKTVAR